MLYAVWDLRLVLLFGLSLEASLGLVLAMSLKCVWFAQAKYREKEEELAEAIDRLEEEMRYASHPAFK